MLSHEHPGVKALILLEHEEEVKNCLQWLDGIEGRKQIVALTPFAMYELDRCGVSYTIPEDYYDPQESYQMGIDNFQKVEQLCDIIDKSIQQSLPNMAKLGITPAWFSFYHLKYIYDSLTIRTLQLLKLLDAEEPSVVFIYESKRYEFGARETAPYLLFDNRESIYAHLLALNEWKIEVKVLSPVSQLEDSYIEKVNYEDFLDKVKRMTAIWLKVHPSLFDMALRIRKKEWHGLLDWAKAILVEKTHIPIVLFGGAYNWTDCREEMRLQGIGPIYRMPDGVQWLSKASKTKFEAATSAWKELQNNGEFLSFFIWREINFFPLVEERFRFLVEQLTAACLMAFQEATRLIKRRGIKAVISSTLATCVGHSVAQAAHSTGIPVITWQHGGYGTTDNPQVDYADLMSSDAHFVFGEGVTEQYAESARRFSTKLVSVGSASLEKLRGTCSSSKRLLRAWSLEKKVVLYVTTNYYQTNVFISSSPPSSDNLFWGTQRAIIDILGKHGECSAVVKLHSNRLYREPLLRVYVEERGFHNFHFIREEHSFTELLLMADIIVCDFPSTTLLQALTMSKPVFVYLGHQHMDEQARRLLERRAVCHSDLQNFTNVLDEYLAEGNIEGIDLNDKEFSKRYGIMSPEGSAGNRAAKALRQIIETWRVNGT